MSTVTKPGNQESNERQQVNRKSTAELCRDKLETDTLRNCEEIKAARLGAKRLIAKLAGAALLALNLAASMPPRGHAAACFVPSTALTLNAVNNELSRRHSVWGTAGFLDSVKQWRNHGLQDRDFPPKLN
ncbi:MAG: hypothetical protein MJH10_11325 [Epibacterium sp.]|nr:hypothetical protein [Epibacterium sp.]